MGRDPRQSVVLQCCYTAITTGHAWHHQQMSGVNLLRVCKQSRAENSQVHMQFVAGASLARRLLWSWRHGATAAARG